MGQSSRAVALGSVSLLTREHQALFWKGWVLVWFPVHRLPPLIEEADTFISSPACRIKPCGAAVLLGQEFQGLTLLLEAGDRGSSRNEVFGLFSQQALTLSGSSVSYSVL